MPCYHAAVQSHALLGLASLLLVLGCGSPPKQTGAEGRAAATTSSATNTSLGTSGDVGGQPSPSETCSAATLEQTLVTYCDFEAQVPSELLAGVSFGGPAFHLLEQRLLIIDERAQVRVVGEAGALELSAWLAQPDALTDTRALVVAIAAALPSERVAELFSALHAAARSEIVVLVRSEASEPPLPQPPSPTLLAAIGEQLSADLGQRAQQLAMQMREHAKACPALGTALASLAAFSPADRCTGMASLVGGALVECECRDADAIMTLLYAISVGTEVPRGRVVAIPVTLDPTRANASNAASWSALVGEALVDAGPTTLWLGGAAAPSRGL